MIRHRLKKFKARSKVKYELHLYTAGQTPKSIAAVANLKKLCAEYLKDQCRIRIVDLVKNPKLAKGDQILVIPTLVRKLPKPVKYLIGDLSDTVKFLVGFDIKVTDRRRPPV